MTPNEPLNPNDDPGPAAEQDALRRLEQRLDQASDAAERLISEAARAAARARAVGAGGSEAGGAAPEEGAGGEAHSTKPPPAGWQLPGSEGPATGGNPEIELLANLLQSLRDLIPPDLQERLVAALRELLLALRALIDWYIERMERRRAQPTEVEDIPIL